MHDDLKESILISAPEGITHLGFIAFDVYNRVLVIEPEDEPYGVTATLPRIRVEKNQTAIEALDRCLKEKIGWPTTSSFPIPIILVTENSSTFYFTGMIKDNDEPPGGKTPRSDWCFLEVARSKIQTSKNRGSRNRDLTALEIASRVERSLDRRILLMVRELHRMGFGRMRVAPWMHQNRYQKPPGTWSCSIVPSVVMRADHGALTDGDEMNRLREVLKVTQHYDPFQTMGNHRPFGWTDAHFDDAGQLAAKFLARFRDLCFIGWGRDPDYERWYEQMIETTAPNGVFYQIVSSNDFVETAFAMNDSRFPAPPLA